MERLMLTRWFLVALLVTALSALGAEPPAGVQASDAGIRHSFLVCGNTTAIVGEDGRREVTFPYGTRDGFVLPNGKVLLAVNKWKEFPGGGVVELTREGKVVFSWKGTQAEVNGVQEVGDGRILLTEAGPKPRLLEIDREGRTRVEFALRCQSANAHM